jgi:hypothetical protein
MAMEYRQGFLCLPELADRTGTQQFCSQDILGQKSLSIKWGADAGLYLGCQLATTLWLPIISTQGHLTFFCELHEARDIRCKLWNFMGILWFHLDSVTFLIANPLFMIFGYMMILNQILLICGGSYFFLFWLLQNLGGLLFVPKPKLDFGLMQQELEVVAQQGSDVTFVVPLYMSMNIDCS